MGSSNMLQKLNDKDEQSVSCIKQESSIITSQLTSSNVQTAFSSTLQLASSSSFQPSGTLPQTVNSDPRISSTIQSEPYSNDSVNSSSMQHGNARDFSPVFSLGTSVISNCQSNSSSNSSYGSIATNPGSTRGISTVPMDPRLKNHGLSVPNSVNDCVITPKMQNHLPVSSQSKISDFHTQSNKHSIASTSKKAKTEIVKNRSRSTVSNGAEKSKTSKKDCADIVVRYLTPYYKSGEVKSKVSIFVILCIQNYGKDEVTKQLAVF